MTKLETKIVSRFQFPGRDEVTEAVVLNPGDWFGKTWLIELGGSYWSTFLIAEGEYSSDAIDVLCDDQTYGHQIWVSDEDAKDYQEDQREYAGNAGRQVDTEHVMIHGRDGAPRYPSGGEKAPFTCKYFGVYEGRELPEEGVDGVLFQTFMYEDQWADYLESVKTASVIAACRKNDTRAA